MNYVFFIHFLTYIQHWRQSNLLAEHQCGNAFISSIKLTLSFNICSWELCSVGSTFSGGHTDRGARADCALWSGWDLGLWRRQTNILCHKSWWYNYRFPWQIHQLSLILIVCMYITMICYICWFVSWLYYLKVYVIFYVTLCYIVY